MIDPAELDLATLAARYDGRAPRYTSYPTAVQFTPEINAGTYAAWLAELDPAKALSLYLHVPFCEQLCWFCGCNTRAVHRRESTEGYLDSMEAEFGLLERSLPNRPRVNAVHFGGGTPNMLTRDDLTRLFGLLRHVFSLTPNCAIAVEMDPAVLTESWVRAAVFHGVSRASLGVQTLAPHVQAAVNRRMAFSRLEAAVGWLRDAGVDSINLDLMYGLPRQTVADVINTIDQILTLRPSRIALFGYAHVPWMKAHQRMIVTADLPGAVQRLEQAERAAERLIQAGYVRIGLDHFALADDALAVAAANGRLRRNFQGYVSEPAAAIIGIGPSSIGSLPRGYVQNHAQETLWRAELAEGRLPIARGVTLTPDNRFRGDIIEQLMCNLRVDLAAVAVAHGRDVSELTEALDLLEPLFADGLARHDGGTLTVSEGGRPFVRTICAAFDEYLGQGDGSRHAVAV